MKYFIALTMVFFSSSLSAQVLTFECVPNDPNEAGMVAALRSFVVDLENKTWDWGQDVFRDLTVSGNSITAETSYMFLGYVNTETFSVSRIDLTYTHSIEIAGGASSYRGQCEIVEDKVERAF